MSASQRSTFQLQFNENVDGQGLVVKTSFQHVMYRNIQK